MNVSHRWLGSGCRFRCRRIYLPTVRGETLIPSFSLSSLAIRSSLQVMLSAAMARMSSRIFLGSGGRPDGFDLYRQNNRNPFRCQRIIVSGLTTTRASRQLKRRREQEESGNQARQGPKAVQDSVSQRTHENKNLTVRLSTCFQCARGFCGRQPLGVLNSLWHCTESVGSMRQIKEERHCRRS